VVDNIEQEYIAIDFDEDVEDVELIDHNFENPVTTSMSNVKKAQVMVCLHDFVILLFFFLLLYKCVRVCVYIHSYLYCLSLKITIPIVFSALCNQDFNSYF